MFRMSRKELASKARPVARVVALAIVMVVAVIFVGRTPGGRPAQAAPAPRLYVTPDHGLAGSTVSANPSLVSVTICPSPPTYYFDSTNVGTSPPADPRGYYPATTLTVPASASPGGHTFTLKCSTAAGAAPYTSVASFIVDRPPATTTTTAPTTTTTLRTTTTTTASSTTTTPGATTTSRPGQTTTTIAGDTTTTVAVSPDSTDTTIPPDTVPGSTSTRAGASLKFTALAIAPGSGVSAIGQGCDPDAPVAVTIDSTPVGRTDAASDGTFRTPLAVSSLAVGRYQVTATCGPTLEAPLDIVLASEVDQGTSTSMIIIVFFVLLGLLAFRRQLFPGAPTTSPAPPAPDEMVES